MAAPATRRATVAGVPVEDGWEAAGPGAWRYYDRSQLPAVLRGALEAFTELGYGPAPIREVARRAGMSVPGLYYHYPSKEAIFVALMEAALSDALARSRRALAEAGDEPVEQLQALVESVILFMVRRADIGILWPDLRTVPVERRAAVPALVREQQDLFERVVEDGVAVGAFTTAHVREAARAAATLCVHVPDWYRADGPLSVEDVIEMYVGFVLAIVGHRADREA